jgi:hypothetical protein
VIERYAVLAGRIRQELGEIEHVVERAERAVEAAGEGGALHDLFLDSAALSLHDFYSGVERLLEQIASNVDRSVPSTHDWHRELLRQMTIDVSGLRRHVLSQSAAVALDRYRRFRHVVRNVYAFELDPESVQQLTANLRAVFVLASAELRAFADFLDAVAADD